MTRQLSDRCRWRNPPQKLALPQNEVHVWRASLDLDVTSKSRLAQTLTQDEQHRANRFHFDRDRDRFLVARGILRVVLGRYLNLSPDQVPIGYTAFGKPILEKPLPTEALNYNLSHSDDVALYAFSHSYRVGIDLERIRPDIVVEEVAERFFSPDELAALRALSTDDRINAFFACWTRKEAYLKARGEGLSIPLDSFDVSLKPGEPAKLLNSRDDPQAVARWSLRTLNVGPGYAATAAVEGHDWQLHCWQFQSNFE